MSEFVTAHGVFNNNAMDKNIYFDFNNFGFSKNPVRTLLYEANYEVEPGDRLQKLNMLITNKCNMRCEYCIANGGSYYNNLNDSFLRIDSFKHSFIKLMKVFPKGIGNIQFFGGEPLIYTEFIIECIEYISEYCSRNNIVPPVFTLVTNGVFLNEENIMTIKKYDIKTTVSIDGTKIVHDYNRKFSDGRGSFETIIQNLKNQKDIDLVCELSISDSHVDNYYEGIMEQTREELIALGIRAIYLNLINSKNAKSAFSNKGDIFEAVVKEYVEKSIDELFSDNIRLFDFGIANIFIKILYKKNGRSVCSRGVNNLTMNTSGDILPCYLSTEIMSYRDDSSEQLQICRGNYLHYDIPNRCRDCFCQPICESYCKEMNDEEFMDYKCKMNRLTIQLVVDSLYNYKSDKKRMNNLINNLVKMKKIFS